MELFQPLHQKAIVVMALITVASLIASLYFVLIGGDITDLFNPGIVVLALFISGSKSISVYWRGKILQWSPDGVVEIAALIIIGLWPTLLAVLINSLIEDALNPPTKIQDTAKMVKKLGSNSLVILVTYAAFSILGGSVGEITLPHDLIALFGMIVMFSLISNSLVFFLRYAVSHPRPWAEFKSHLNQSSVYLILTAIEGILGVLFVLACQEEPWLLVLLILYPALLLWSFKQGSNLQRANDQALEAFASLVDMRNEKTAEHSKRVADYAWEIGRTMALTSGELDRLYWTSRLHDLGSIAIDPSLLNKKEKLSDTETQFLRSYAATSASILTAFSFSPQAVEIVLAHHERPDGKGYYGYAYEKIPRESLIISVANAYDAMISPRPYRAALSTDDAAQELLSGRDTQFDKDVVDAFLYIQDPIKYPDYATRLPARYGDIDWAVARHSHVDKKNIKFDI